jgi:Holliday junction resolvasome RuvABC endonuclease subunit
MIRLVLGIDPGIAACGIALIEHDVQQPWRLKHVQTVRTKAVALLNDRMREVYAAMKALLREPVVRGTGGVVVACEEQTGVQEGKRRSGETSASATLVQQVVGMARAATFSAGLQFVEPTPAQVKAVLPGIPRTASKAQVQRAVRAIVRDCPEVMSEHESDAIAVALAGARMC